MTPDGDREFKWIAVRGMQQRAFLGFYFLRRGSDTRFCSALPLASCRLHSSFPGVLGYSRRSRLAVNRRELSEDGATAGEHCVGSPNRQTYRGGRVDRPCIPGRRDVCYSTPGSYGEYVFLLGGLDWPHMPKLITSAREKLPQ